MRTFKQIVKKCQDSKSMFGFDKEVLVPYLPYSFAKEFLNSDSTEKSWAPRVKNLKKMTIIKEMKAYMEFAWRKVRNHRGLSAGRSVERFQAWLWLLEDEELLRFSEADGNYPQYGAPILAAICQKYGFEIPEGKDLENMIAGKKCDGKSCPYQGCGE